MIIGLAADLNFRAIIERTGWSYERNLRLISEFTEEAVFLHGMMPRIEGLAKNIEAIRGIEISEDGYSLHIKTEETAPVERVLGEFLGAFKKEYHMKRIIVQCAECLTIERRTREIVEVIPVDLNFLEEKPAQE